MFLEFIPIDSTNKNSFGKQGESISSITSWSHLEHSES